MKTLLKVDGMSCKNCVRHVREAIESIPDVQSVSVNLDKAEALITWKNSPPTYDPVLQAIKKAGYLSRVIA